MNCREKIITPQVEDNIFEMPGSGTCCLQPTGNKMRSSVHIMQNVTDFELKWLRSPAIDLLRAC